jgi:hypothetical protein
MSSVSMRTAVTTEIDDFSLAVSEVLAQLKYPEVPFKPNVVGIVHCYYEFVESGCFAALQDALPFPLLGTVTNYCGTDEGSGGMSLVLSVFESSTVRIACELGSPIDTDLNSIDNICQKMSAQEKPRLLLSYLPLLTQHFGGDQLIERFNEVLPGVPLFGNFPVTNNEGYVHADVLFCGKSYRNCVALAGFYGDVKPQVFTRALPDGDIMGKEATVDKVNGTVLQVIDGKPTIEYLTASGLEHTGDNFSLMNLLLIATLKDGSKVARAMIQELEDGAMQMVATLPEGSKVSVCGLTPETVTESAKEALHKASLEAPNQALLCYSCLNRYWVMGMQNEDEECNILKETLGNTAPWLLAYSGGEICPAKTNDNHLVNHLQNSTLVVLAL